MASKKKGSARQPGQPGQSQSDQLVTSPAVNCSHCEMREAKSLNGNPKNPNKHPEEQLRIYAKILRHQGWRKPIVVSIESGLIVTGHGAWLTAVAEGWDQVPIDLQSFKSPEDEFAHMVADNRLPQMSEMAEAELSALIEREIAGKLDIELAGLVEALDQGLNKQAADATKQAEERPSVAGEAQKKWKVKAGEIFQAGRHRVMCGSCLNAGDLDRLIGGAKIDLIYSDAPYGISIVNPLGKGLDGIAAGPSIEEKRGRRRQAIFGKVGGIHRGMKAAPIISSNVYPEILGDDNGATARQAFGLLWRRFPRAAHIWWGANHFSVGSVPGVGRVVVSL